MSDRPDPLETQPDIQSNSHQLNKQTIQPHDGHLLAELPTLDSGSHPPEADVTIPPNWRYEATVAEIETIINQIELGELDLADVFDQFATAVQQLRQCETFLTRQKQQVDLLIETLLDEPEPF